MNKSFTLIELLIVVAIIGILALTGISSYMNSIKSGKDARRKADLSAIQKALEAYYQDNDSYPPDNGGVLPDDGNGAFCHPSGDCSVATYLQVIPTDPRGGQYMYESDGTGSYYKLFACIENPNDAGPGVNQAGYGPACGIGICDPCKYGISSTNTTP